jgi:hypothetical protein
MEQLNGENLISQVQGKVKNIEVYPKKDGGKLYRTIILAPARNEYEGPNTICVLGSRALGAVDDIVTASVQIRGRYYRNDKNETKYYSELWESRG